MIEDIEAADSDDAGASRPRVRRLLASAAATAVLQVASNGAGFLTSILLARFLGGDGYGQYVFALAWAGLLSTPAILGLDRFLVRGIAVYEVASNWALMRGLLRRTHQLVAATSLSIAAVGCLVAALWLAPEMQGPFVVAMLFLPISTLTLLRQGAMQAFGYVVTGQLPELVVRPVVLLAVIVWLNSSGGGALTATTAVGANIAGMAAAYGVGAYLLRRARPFQLRQVLPEYATREWIRASLPMMMIAGVWAANNYVATLVVGTMEGPEAAGVYSVVEKGSGLIVLLLLAVNMPLAPAIARLYARGDRGGLEHASERVAQAAFMASLPLAAVFVLVPSLYLGLFGEDFGSGATALGILAVAQLVNSAAGPAGNVLMMTGHERSAVAAISTGLFVNVGLALALVPPLGVTGAAIGAGGSLIVWNGMLVVLARRKVHINVTALRALSMARPA